MKRPVGRPRIHPARAGVSRQALSLAAKRAAVSPRICPVCVSRPRAAKKMKVTGKVTLLAKCDICGEQARRWAAAHR